MSHHIQATRIIPAAASDLWQTVSAMTAGEDWCHGLISHNEVLEPGSDQPLRTCAMQDGGALKERILLRDDPTRTFVYAIDCHPLPAGNVVGVIRIDDLGDARSHVT